MGHSFDTLTIQVTGNGTSASFRVQVTTANGQTQSGVLQLGGLASVPPPGGHQSLQNYGRELFARLFAPPVDQVFLRALNAAIRNDRILRVLLWLDSQDSTLHDIPWELLYYHTGGDETPQPLAASPHLTFARYIGTDRQPFTPISTRPLTLSLLVAAPKDLGSADGWHDLIPINRDFEHQHLTASLDTASNARQITLTKPAPVTPATLHQTLHAGTNVLVFFGHALHHPTYGTRLVLEDPLTHDAVLYDGNELVAQLRQLAPTQRPALIVLTACNTAAVQHTTPAPAPADQLQPSAPALLAAQLVNAGGVPAVLAMQRLVDIRLARTFTATLNEQLLRHGNLDLAVRNTRQRIFQHDDPAWGTPVLYMRMSNGQLFTPNVHLEYLQLLREDERLVRWQRDEYIHMHALAVPPERSWHLLHTNPHDAPAGRDAIETLRQTLLHDPTTPPTPIFFVGKPRSGQTTSVLRLTSDLVEAALQQDDYRRSIPVYVPLDTYQHQYGSNRLAETIIQAASTITPAIRPELEELLLREREQRTPTRYIWLLDGFESIPEGLRTEAAHAIQQLVKRLPAHRVLVSTVDEAFRSVSFPQARVVLLQPLNDRLIQHYLAQRYGEQARVLMRRLQEARLMELATDPSLLRMIAERLMQDSTTAFTEARLLQSILDLLFSNVTLPDIPGDVVHQTLNTLAWEYRWRQVTSMSLNEIFAIMHNERQGRDYNLETLFRVYRDAGIFSTISPQRVTFAFPAIQSYCAARALLDRPDSDARLHDILSMCGVSERFSWWEGTLAAVVALLDTPAPIQHLADVAVLEQSSSYIVLLARLLQSLSERAKQQLTDQQRMMLLDTCAMYLRPDREPVPARRAQIATALGNLNFARVPEELHRALVTRLRPTATGMQYDIDLVRIALARAIHRALVQHVSDLPQPLTPATLHIAHTLHATPATHDHSSSPSEASTRLQLALRRLGPSEPSILAVFTAWLHCTLGTAAAEQQGRAHLRAVLLAPGNDHTPLARALAAFALGDMARATADADLMFAMIVRPPAFGVAPHDWNDAVWAAASALNLFDPRLTARKLQDYLSQHPEPRHNIAQLAYLAGQSRANDKAILAWLVHLVVNHPAFSIKASALMALAWAGQTTSTPSWVLSELPERDDLYDAEDERVPPIRRLIEAIADWDVTALENMATTFVQHPVPPDADITRLRRMALEALALVGDQATLDTLNPRADQWHLELRSAWHLASRTIRARILLAGQEPAIA